MPALPTESIHPHITKIDQKIHAYGWRPSFATSRTQAEEAPRPYMQVRCLTENLDATLLDPNETAFTNHEYKRVDTLYEVYETITGLTISHY